jgi:DNA helicase-2/ATP-dependent DNA helicase PcrA
MMDILAELNPAQREAVEAINGPVLILAGPGSGKTRVITHRIAYLIKVCGVSPHRIMAVTFTNKAAREMEERLHRLVSSSVEDLTIGTFHATCARILRRDGKAIGVNSGFVIYDDEDQISLIKRSLQALDLDPKQYAPRAIQSAITSAKSRLLAPAEYLPRSYFEEVVQRVYERYQQLLSESNALDFDDLLLKAVNLFRQNSQVLSKYQSRYLHLQVDEFQDTNLVQYELMKQLAGKYRNICVVGDPDQSIYSWRFADLRNILNFEKDYPEAKVVLLEQNYRSTKMILETASHIISANEQRKPKGLWTENETGALPEVVETYTEQEEAQFVVNEVEQLVSRGEFKRGDCAITYRTNAQSRVLEEAFIRYGVPYKLVAGTRFYERREVKDVIAYLRLIQNPYDSVSLLRIINIPQRGIGQRSLSELSQWARSRGMSEYRALQLLVKQKEDETAEDRPPFPSRTLRAFANFVHLIEGFVARSRELNLVDLFDLVVESSGYRKYILAMADGEERRENILELRTVAQGYSDLKPPEGLSAFLEGVTLVSDVDGLDESIDAVTLITLHQAKGLEFPVVFIVGMEDGILPHIRSFDDPGQMEEERRLCYVGITRAKKKVYLVRAFRRSFMGGSNINRPSRFLQDIPPHLLSGGSLWQGEDSQLATAMYSWNRMATPREALPDLSPGDHVHHAQFGDGVVVSLRPVKDDAEVVVAFDGAGIKKLLLSFAKLEKIK